MQRKLALFALTLFPLALFAQPAPAPAAKPACPKIETTSPDMVTAGEELTITANVSDGDPDVTPTYNWSISDGTISSGQGTSSITIDSAAVTSGTVTATVEVGGYDRECSSTSSSTVTVEAKKNDEKPPR